MTLNLKNEVMIPFLVASLRIPTKLKYGFHHYVAEVEVVNVNISQETIFVDKVLGRLQ